MLHLQRRETGNRCNDVTPVAIQRKTRNVCNDTTRLLDRRSQNRAAKLLAEVASVKGKRGAARLLHINPGTVVHIINNTDKSWTHVTLDKLLLAKIELMSEYVKHDAELSEDIKARIDRAMELTTQLTSEMRELKRKIGKR